MLIFETKGRSTCSLPSDLSTYWYRGRVNSGVEGQRTHIFSLFFVTHMSWKMLSENERFKLMRAYTFTKQSF